MKVIESNIQTGEVEQREMTQAEQDAIKNNQPVIVVDPKLTGIEFDGVMCSATRDDQAGLMAVLMAKQMQGDAFKPTSFYFANGNKLVITKDNIAAFTAVWMPFRQSFFVAVQRAAS
jgi:hypothetical protein